MKKQIASIALACVAVGGGIYGVTQVLQESTGQSIVKKNQPIVTALPSQEVISIPTTVETTQDEVITTSRENNGIKETATIYDEYTNNELGFYVSVSSYNVERITNGVSFECDAVLKNIGSLDKKLTISSIRLIDENTNMQYACTSSYIGNTSLPNKNEVTLASNKTDYLSFKGSVGIKGTETPKCALYLSIKDSVSGDTLNLYIKLHSSIYDSKVTSYTLTEEELTLEKYGITISHKESKTMILDSDIQIVEFFTITNKADSPIELFGYISSLTTNGVSSPIKTTTNSDISFPNSVEEMKGCVLDPLASSGIPTDDNVADLIFSTMVNGEAGNPNVNPVITFSIYLQEYHEIVEFTYNVVL